MAEVKWVKVATDMFDSSRKIKQIEMMPEGDTIIVIWIKLLLLAGSVNDGGAIYLTPEIPYTDEMLATELRRPLNTVKMALTIFERFGMIEVQDEVLHLASWEKYQNVEGMEKIREQTRARVADYRARKRKELAKGEECAYCGKHADTIDHIVPRSKGGEDVADNIVPCCKSCNSSKKDKDLADFLNDSYFFPYQGIDHERVRRNEKLMRFVNVDMKLNRYCNVTVTLGNAVEEEEEKEKESHSFIHAREEAKLKFLGGTLGKGVVMLSEEQIDSLLEELTLDEFNKYVEIVADAELRGKHYSKKTHYQAILDMVAKDRRSNK